MSSCGTRVGPSQAAVPPDRRAYERGAPNMPVHSCSSLEANPVDPVPVLP
jgi:hypothetical protein